MDYSNDDCMAMFTRGQAERVWNVLNTSRSGLKSSANSKCSTTNPPIASFNSDLKNICSGTVVTFRDQSTGSPNKWSWLFEKGTPSTSTDENPTVIYNEGGSFNVSLISTNDNGASNVKMESSYISVIKIDTAVLQSSTICNGDITVSGTSPMQNANIEWYSDIQLQNQLAIGASYTSNLVQETMFYAVVNSGGNPDFVGNLTKGNGGFHAGNQGVIFNVTEEFVLQTLEVNVETAGDITIEYTNPDGVKTTKVIAVQVGLNTVNMNIDMVVGNDHKLFMPSGNVSLHRDNSGVSYPYDLGGLGSVYNSTATGGVNLDYYYYFYNWKIQKKGCLSDVARISVTPDNCVNVEELKSGVSMFPNPSDGNLTINNLSGLNGSVSIYDIRGAIVFVQKITSKNVIIENLSEGTYVVKVQTTEHIYQERIIVK
jgi:PKD repeat protein